MKDQSQTHRSHPPGWLFRLAGLWTCLPKFKATGIDSAGTSLYITCISPTAMRRHLALGHAGRTTGRSYAPARPFFCCVLLEALMATRLTTFVIDPATDSDLNFLAHSTKRSRAEVIRDLIRTEANRRRSLAGESRTLSVVLPARGEVIGDAR